MKSKEVENRERMSSELNTGLIGQMLKDSDSFTRMLRNCGNAICDPTLSKYLCELREQSGKSIAEIADAAYISYPFAYQIFSGRRNPGKDMIICIARVLFLDLASTQRLLKLSNKGELYPRVGRDAAVIFSIEHEYTLEQMDELIVNAGFKSLLKRTL